MTEETPTVPTEHEARYAVALASGEGEIAEALRLRYRVFNLELGEGLRESDASGCDRDAFDAVMDHLLVRDNATREVVGTYRMQTGRRAAEALGFYSAREFDFSPFRARSGELLELGRACVAPGHRNATVVGLLWREIIRYALSHGARFLVGCSSLTGCDPAPGWAMFRHLAVHHLADEEFQTVPLPDCILPEVPPAAGEPVPPRLLRAYLAVGAKICGPPALDRQFGTTDFLTILDCHAGTRSATAHFLQRLEKA